LGVKLLLGRLNGGGVRFYMGSLSTSLLGMDGTAAFMLWSAFEELRPLLGFYASLYSTAETLMSCVPSMRVGVLPPTPSTLYLGSYRSLYGTFTVLVIFRSTTRFMMRLSLTLRSSVAETSRAKG